MTINSKLLIGGFITAAFALVAVILPSAWAATPSSIEGGDIYRVRNLTKGGDFTNAANADKCEELQYRVRIHNPGPDEVLTGVTVQATIPAGASTQNVSTVIIRAANASPASVSDTATVNLPAAYKISYVPGSSQLLDASGNVMQSIGDVTSGSGVNIGNLGISINERRFVQFKAKVDCPDTPPPVEKKFVCKGIAATAIDRTRYKVTATAQVQNVTIQKYVFTVTRDGNRVDERTVTTGAASADYDFNQSNQGTYIVSAVITTDAGPTTNTCAVQITVPKEGDNPPPPVTPPTPGTPGTPGLPGAPGMPGSSGSSGGGVTVLPETGPAGIAALGAAVSAISTAVYYLYQRRFMV